MRAEAAQEEVGGTAHIGSPSRWLNGSALNCCVVDVCHIADFREDVVSAGKHAIHYCRLAYIGIASGAARGLVGSSGERA